MVDNTQELREIELWIVRMTQKKSVTDFETYCTYVDPTYKVIATQQSINIHKWLIEVYSAVATGKIKRLRVSCPPRLWKSKLGWQLLPTWYLWGEPNKDFVLASYDANLAGDFTRKSRDIVKTQRYRNVFPKFELAADQDTKTHRETKERWGMYWVWVWWALTGKWWHILYIDDPVKNMEEAQSPVIQEKIWDWFDSVVSTRKQDEDSAIVVTMTRWNIDDLAWRIKEKEKEWWEVYYEHTIKAIDDAGFPIIRPWKRWPQYYFKERENRSHKVRQALFQQDPVEMSWVLFKPWNERPFLESDFEKVWWLKKSDIVMALIIDPAFSSSIKSDDVVVIAMWIHKLTKDLYIFDVFADTQAPSIARNMVFNMAMRWEMKWFNKPWISDEVVHINKDQTKFKMDLLEEMKTRNQYYVMYDYSPKTDKMSRIKFVLEPLRTMNKIYINENLPAEVKKRLLEQFYKFPNLKKDDIIDCIAQWAIQLPKYMNNWTPLEKKVKTKYYDPYTNSEINEMERND